ncbi:hypothetical protein ACOMCU_26805 [Lysinibacillus sp. UGB7]|uniref:hypothetical protein n=1 Tax=Lysinibacillus sp. UGB7 TaxID=3411039 RepID=UPI003B773161
MKLQHAVSVISALPKLLNNYGIFENEVIQIHFDPTTNDDVKLSVQLSSGKAIKRLGVPEVKTTYEGNFIWTRHSLVKDNIAFVCSEFVIEQFEHEAIA